MEQQQSLRYHLLDELRGLDLISMMLYHGMWDVVFLFGIPQKWYIGRPGFLWQQSICWVFICFRASACRWGIIRSGGELSYSGLVRWSRRSRCSSCRRTWCGSVC